jgi:hypothetical protein
LRQVLHLDFEDHLVEIRRNHSHDEVVDIGLARGDRRRDLRQGARPVDRFHSDRDLVLAILMIRDIPAHIDPGDV